MKHLASWIEKSTIEQTLNFMAGQALSQAAKGGSQGEIIAGLVKDRNYRAICDFKLDYAIGTAEELRRCRQALGFFQKLECLPLGIDKRAVAKAKFDESEAACRLTNEIFKLERQGLFSFGPEADMVLHRARIKIARVLGSVPSFDRLKFRFGPGATVLTKKRQANAVSKLTAGFSCSEDLLPFAARLLEELPHFVSLHEGPAYCRLSDREECSRVPVQVCPGKLSFVPKNAKTYRSIVVEPSLNSMVQLGVGDYMARRMLAFGIDLSDQTCNQDLARKGSIDGSLATLDLSSASDTISTELVATLLPVDWFLFLDSIRTSTVTCDGQLIRLEKFSSMGNGFTFPLESLIFWALSSSASMYDNTVSVYGDDIIVQTEDVGATLRILTLCGFTVNVDKSYWTGFFRESCGADFIRGFPIRPYYQKELVGPDELFKLHNFYVRHGDFEEAETVLESINESLRIYGPDGYGDGHLLGDWKPRRHKRHASHGYEGFLFDTFRYNGRRDRGLAMRPGDRVLPLYSIYTRSCEDAIAEQVVIQHLDRRSPRERILFRNRYLRLDSLQVEIAGEPLPEEKLKDDAGVLHTVKRCTLPGVNGYKRVRIYTFDSPR